jgi:hypothetical protein
MSQSPEQQQQFLSILNGMLDLMSNLNEGEYLEGANMCKNIKELVENMRTNTVYIYMNREKQKGITNQEKLSSNNYLTCPNCNLIVRKDKKSIRLHNKCKTHIRGVYMNKLINNGYNRDEINDFIKRKMFVLSVDEKFEKLYWVCKKHSEIVNYTDEDKQKIYEFYRVGKYRVPYYIE